MLQRGILPLPKSVTLARIAENADLFDFTLSDADCAAIDAIRAPAGKNPDEIDFKIKNLPTRQVERFYLISSSNPIK